MNPPARSNPYLSVVAASRNDDHGGDPLSRTQIFINCFARQCEKHRLPAELILVDWNPVDGRPGLASVLQLPAESAYCQARVITVPAALHQQFKYADRLSFFQMIAKNVGIRRAFGQFIVATNIDIIFSDELIRLISRQQLDPTRMFRVDRYDIKRGLPSTLSLDETLDYAWTHPVRSNPRSGSKALLAHLYGDDTFRSHCQPDPDYCRQFADIQARPQGDIWALHVARDTPLENLHTNACGDFTLLSRQGWDAITGYPEFEAFSFNIDSVGLAAAHYAGFTEVALLPPCVCFHIEHSLGSGWTPEGERKLFARLNETNILNPEWSVLTPFVDAMRRGQKPTALNGPDWGLARFDLPEAPLVPGRMVPTANHPRDYSVPPGLTVCALLPHFDLDRITLWHEREQSDDGPYSPFPPHAVQVFVSDAAGQFYEERSLMFVQRLHQRTTLQFFLNPSEVGARLRLDPTHQNGVVEIYGLELLDPATSQIIWRLDANTALQLTHGGNSRPLPPSPPEIPFRLHSSGHDPQLLFPPLPLEAKTYLLRVELMFLAPLGTAAW